MKTIYIFLKRVALFLLSTFLLKRNLKRYYKQKCEANNQSKEIKTFTTKTITNLEVLGIFLWKLAADVESNMIKEISSGTPPVFTSFDKTSSLGMICICTSLFTSPDVVTTSTRTKSVLTFAFQKNSQQKSKTLRNI